MTDQQLSADMNSDEQGTLLRRITGERGQVLVMSINPETEAVLECRSDEYSLTKIGVTVLACVDCSTFVGILPRDRKVTVLCNSCCIRQGEL